MKAKVREIAVVDHLKCGEPVWKGARYYCPKHPRIPVPKIREAAGAKREPRPEPPEPAAPHHRKSQPTLPEPGMPSAVFLDALLQRLRQSLLTEVEDLAAVGDSINKRLDAIDEKLESILTEPDHARLDADIMEGKLEEIRAELARIDLGGVELAPAAEPPAEAPAKPPAGSGESKW